MSVEPRRVPVRPKDIWRWRLSQVARALATHPTSWAPTFRLRRSAMKRLANLRRDTPDDVYARLVRLEWPPRPPSDAALAARYGDTESRQVHPDLMSARRKWIATWRAELWNGKTSRAVDRRC